MAGLLGSGPVAAWWAGRRLDSDLPPGTWIREQAPPSPPGHLPEPSIHLGRPPAGLPHHRLSVSLHRGERRLDLVGGPGRWLEALEALGAPPGPLGDLLLAAHSRPWRAGGLRALAGSLGVTLSPRAGAKGLAGALPDDWARWLDLPLLAAGLDGPGEATEEALLVLLGEGGGPWVVSGLIAWEREVVARWEAAGGAVTEEGRAPGPAAPGRWLGERLGWPARRFVQVVGTAPAEHTGRLHVMQPDPALPAREENLLVALVRPPDPDRPAREGRRAFAGCWFAEEWWTEGKGEPPGTGALVTDAAERLFPGFEAEGVFVPPAPTRWDGAWGRPDAPASFAGARRRAGTGFLGVAGLPSGCHLSALAAAG